MKAHFKNNIMRTCKECGNEYSDAKRKSFCSNTCGKRVLNRTKHVVAKARPAMILTQSIGRHEVYQRYGMHCAMCGIKADGEKYSMHAPELDHVIPLSKAGNHTYINVQLLCRSCNLKKAAKAPTEYEFTIGRLYRRKRQA